MTFHRPILIALMLLALVGCDANSASGPTHAVSTATSSARDAQAGWTRAAKVPMSPRTQPVLAWTGTEVVVVGGNTGWMCPPNADCVAPSREQLAADGAAWNPDTDSWRAIAPAPVKLLSGWSCAACSAYVNDRLIVDAGHWAWKGRARRIDRWLSYDPATDTWERLRSPGRGVVLGQDDGTRVWSMRGDKVIAWNPLTGKVDVIAVYDVADPLQDVQLLRTDLGPALVGADYRATKPSQPILTRVDLWTGTRWRRYATRQLGGFSAVDGDRLLGLEQGGADGGQVDPWPRWYPFGGRLDLNTGKWSSMRLPRSGNWNPWHLTVPGGPVRIVSGQYATRTGWRSIGRPDSDLDFMLSTIWAGDRLFVFGGAEEKLGYEQPAPPEAWIWTPPT